MNSRTAAYCPRVAGSSARASADSWSRSRPLSWVRSGGVGQARDRVFLLAGDVQGGPAGDHGLELGCRAQEVADERRGRGHLLEVVEDEEQPPVAQPVRQRLGDRARPGLGDAHRCRRSATARASGRGSARGHEEDAVGKVVGDGRRELQRQPRLARPAGPGQGQQAGRGQEPRGLLELGCAPDERGQLGRQVVGPGVGRAERREVRREVVGLDLDDVLRAEQVLEPVGAEVAQPNLDRQVRLDERAGGVGQEDLATVPDRRDPGSAVDVQADQALAGELGLARMDADPNTNRLAFRPRLGGQRSLGRDRCSHRCPRAGEDHEERIALGALLDPVVGAERLAQDLLGAVPGGLAYRAVPTRCSRRVDPSMSLNRKVNVPLVIGSVALIAGGSGSPQWWRASDSSAVELAQPARQARAGWPWRRSAARR